MAIDYFPARLATGNRFCNRVKEQAELKRNIKIGRHTVLVSPRRYGKSSLVHKVVGDIGLPATYIDFFMAHDDRAITLRLLNGIAEVISQIMPVSQKTLAILEKYFTRLRVSLSVKGFTFSLSYNERELDTVSQIYEALKSLVKLAEEENKKVVLFIDEFQDITNAENAKSIQGALRSIAQEFQQIIFIFSGSSRRLLLEIFDDSKKPFYMLCDKIELDRMISADYRPYVQKAAEEKWKSAISDAAFRKMMSLTELHPFYVNMLGNQLCKNDSLPDEKAVICAWNDCLEIERRRIIAEVEHLTLNQQKALKYLAFNPVLEPLAKSALNEVNLSVSSMKMALKYLLDHDLVFQVTFEDECVPTFKKGQYRVLDPLLSYSLRGQP